MRSAFPNSVASNLGEKTTTKNTMDAHNISTSSTTVTDTNVCASIIRIRSVDFHRVIIVKSSSLNASHRIIPPAIWKGARSEIHSYLLLTSRPLRACGSTFCQRSCNRWYRDAIHELPHYIEQVLRLLDLREVACIRDEGEASVGQRLGADPTIHGI